MENYDGGLSLACDILDQSDQQALLFNYAKRSIHFVNIDGTEQEEEDIKNSMNISLKKMKIEPIQMINMSYFNLTGLIYHGNFNRMWKAEIKNIYSLHKLPIALKQICVEMNSPTLIWKERDFLIFLKHERVCSLLAAFYDRDIYYVFELCLGSVERLRNQISPRNAVRHSVQLIQAVKWLESKNVVHANIKPNNCLINSTNNLVVSDFSCAFRSKEKRRFTKLTASQDPGFLDYNANRNLEFSTKTDVFSVACVIFEMDTKNSFLYYHGIKQSQTIYIDAFENGRFTGQCAINLPSNDMERENLSSRAMRSKFGILLKKMTQEENRVSAAEALDDTLLHSLLEDVGVGIENLDDDASNQEVAVDSRAKFFFYTDSNPIEIDLAFLAFHYVDEVIKEELKVYHAQKRRNADS